MPFYMILSPDREGALSERLAHRQEHLQYWGAKSGVVKVAGAILGPDGPRGSSFLLETDGEDQARALIADDPFSRRGVFAGGISLVEVRPAIGDWVPA